MNNTYILNPVAARTRRGIITAVLAIAVALMAVSCSRGKDTNKDPNVDYYTCTMHTSVRSQDPDGKCPICGMGLVPVMKKSKPAAMGSNAVMAEAPSEFVVPVNRQQQIGVTYTTVAKGPLRQTIRVAGNVTYDKQRHWDYVARVDGYVQKLQVSSRGDRVEKDQALMTIYSPDLLNAQQEFLDLLHMRDAAIAGSQPSNENAEKLITSAKRRLLLWNITTNQIAEIEKSRRATEVLTLYAPFDGVVQDLPVDQGRRVSAGDHLVDVADLSTVWVWAEFYQEELPLLKKDMPVTVTSSSHPGRKFTGTIAVIDPFINDATRTGRVRVEVPNADRELRPQEFVDVGVDIEAGDGLVVAADAVMPTGTHNIVFVDKGEGRLDPRMVELGRKFGTNYLVTAGLEEGDRVVSSANFLIDAEAKVQGALKSW
jgi:Cu(I)/Ag(I) efflux system membrane fusion protein